MRERDAGVLGSGEIGITIKRKHLATSLVRLYDFFVGFILCSGKTLS